MRALVLRLVSACTIAVRRLRAQFWLALATSLGLVLLVALVMSIPAYSDAVSYRLLSANLQAEYPDDNALNDHGRAPFVFLFQYNGPFRGAAQWEQVAPFDAYLTSQVSQDLGLPRQGLTRLLQSFPFQLYSPANVPQPGETQTPYSWTSFTALSSFREKIRLVEGQEPRVVAAGDPLQVLVSQAQADWMGLSVGDEFIAYNRDAEGETKIPVKISGVWSPLDTQDPAWIVRPQELTADLLVDEETFLTRLADLTGDEMGQATWAVSLDSSSFHAGDVAAFLPRITRVQRRIESLLNGAILRESPEDLLREYRRTTVTVTFLLTAYSLPFAALFLAFINLVGSVMVERQRNEIAMLRSRGATTWQVAGMAAFESLLLSAGAMLVAIPVSQGIILLMGKTRAFLDFSLPGSLRLGLNSTSLLFGVGACLLVLAARLSPVLSATRQTIVSYKRETARSNQTPWWQRVWLDAALLLPAAYGMYLLSRQGSLALPGVLSDPGSGDPYQNPLLLLIPALGIFAAALLLLRLLPGLMSAIAWAAARTPVVSLLIAARHLARSPRFYSTPLILLVLTLSLSTFTASLARTLDSHFHDQQYYNVGADVALIEAGQCLKYDPFGYCDRNASTETSPTWAFLPVSTHLQVPGVQAAARVGTWPARAAAGGIERSGSSLSGRLLGIDRLDFPAVAYWRSDFATDSLGALMNALAEAPQGALVSGDYLKQAGLSVGDPLLISMEIAGKSLPLDLIIAGSFDYFPTWYPQDGPLFVANLDYVFDQAQGQQPYNVWLKTEPAASCRDLTGALRNKATLGLDVVGCSSVRERILKEQSRPEHQGLFGLLSVAFGGAALLTALGFLLYLLFSFQRRTVEVGVLRAVGLSASQVRLLLVWELTFLMAIGVSVGTGLGVWVSRLFIPYLQVGARTTAYVPPFVIEIGWGPVFQVYSLFAVLFIAALAGLSVILSRTKMSQAIKLGETT